MAEDGKQTDAKTRKVRLKSLFLDPNNYRLIHEADQIEIPDDRVKEKDVVSRTNRLIVGDRNQNIQDLIESFKSNDYLPVDQIQVRELEGGGYIVVEGNRRVATLKYLQNEYELKNIDLGNLRASIFSKVPVVLYENTSEVHHLTLMALKHISGNRKWGEWNQAKLLEKMVHTFDLSEDEVCRRVSISKTELRRSLRALGLANQYQNSDYGDQFRESMFSIFREAARNTAIKEWIGWDETKKQASNLENLELFYSWLSKEPIEDEDDSDISGYFGDYLDPAILKRDDIVTLSKIIRDSTALESLKETRNLNEAFRTSDVIFKEKIKDAIAAVVSDVKTLEQLSLNQDQVPQLEGTLGKLRGIVEKARSGSFQGVEQNSVFYNRIDSHFSCIKVNAYRGLSGLMVNKLSKINLFAGVNNSGKTSLLEAIYLLCKQNDFNGMVDILRQRGKIPEDHIPSRWLVEQLTETVDIEGVFDNKDGRVEIKPFQEESLTLDRSRYLKSVKIATKYDTHELEALIRIYQGGDKEIQSDMIKLLSRVVYSSPFFFNEPHHYTTFYHNSVQSKLLPKIFQFIQEKVVPTVKDIRLVDEFQRFLVDDDCFDHSMDLTSYGEGLQRIFFTSLLFASAENGVVLIDEFENGIHADLMATFVPFIHSLAKEFNVQIFLTSHSKECIDAFIKTAHQEDVSDFAFHALIRKDNREFSLKEFEGEMFSKLISAADIDLRRVK